MRKYYCRLSHWKNENAVELNKSFIKKNYFKQINIHLKVFWWSAFYYGGLLKIQLLLKLHHKKFCQTLSLIKYSWFNLALKFIKVFLFFRWQCHYYTTRRKKTLLSFLRYKQESLKLRIWNLKWKSHISGPGSASSRVALS